MATIPESSYADLWWHDACPKCRGSLYLCKDSFGHYRKCINCGQHHYRLPPGVQQQPVPLHPDATAAQPAAA